MLGYGTEAISDVIPIQLECLAAGIDAPERNVDVGMFRVEVRYRYPLERRMEVGSHPTHHVPRQSPQVETLAELGRDYQLPKPRIAAILPFAKPGSNVDTVDSAPSRISPVREKNSHGRCIGHARTNGL